MEINQHPHACIGCPLTDLNRCIHVIIASAVSIFVFIIRIIPDTDTDIIDAAIMKQVKESLIVQFISFKIVINNTTVLLSDIGGNINPADEIF